MIKGIIFAYVVIAMLYYLLTVCLFASKTIENSIIDIMPIINGDTLSDLKKDVRDMVHDNDILCFLVISICGLIGGFGLPILIITGAFKRG